MIAPRDFRRALTRKMIGSQKTTHVSYDTYNMYIQVKFVRRYEQNL